MNVVPDGGREVIRFRSQHKGSSLLDTYACSNLMLLSGSDLITGSGRLFLAM
ncbi:hypothetical protein [Paenibacillus agricola]|uniref:Uncharacterized protein n=1 Tax=Paenibacillus agricola TaxID=2716264 RepID=A0ABX0J0B1_9BACL|nr:hypothetical protein [Paenibacillus agricola]NHN29707.1 hypothetical protein [Paenibacillus agricola]